MATSEKYPGPILVKLSAMMDELMLIAEQIEAHERARRRTTPFRNSRSGPVWAENVVPFPGVSRQNGSF